MGRIGDERDTDEEGAKRQLLPDILARKNLLMARRGRQYAVLGPQPQRLDGVSGQVLLFVGGRKDGRHIGKADPVGAITVLVHQSKIVVHPFHLRSTRLVVRLRAQSPSAGPSWDAEQ